MKENDIKPILSESVNAFVLTVMEVNTAKVNLNEFTFGLLHGYVEMSYDSKGFPKVENYKAAKWNKQVNKHIILIIKTL